MGKWVAATLRRRWPVAPIMAAVALGVTLTACGGGGAEPVPTQPGSQLASATTSLGQLSGTIAIDGSSTVFPITEAMAEEFRRAAPNVRVTVGVSGTGGGFKKFCAKETVISDASRPIKQTEVQACQQNGVEFIELPVAFDGLAVLVNPQNDWVESFTVQDLKRMWEPAAQGKVMKWSDVRPEWPDQPLRLYGPGVDSGTYDYFTEAIVGEDGASRGDFAASEDDNVLVQGIAGDKYATGFFGLAYYSENQDRLRLVPIVPPDGGSPVLPTEETVSSGTYQPLSRPIFIYVSREAADRPEVQAFVKFYLENAAELVGDVGFVPLPSQAYALALQRFERRVTGSVFSGGSQIGVSIEDLLRLEE